MVVQEKWISAEEFWEIAQRPENADKHMELIDGVIYEMPLFGFEHGVIAGNFSGFVGMYVRAQHLGRVTAASGYLLSADTVLAPDVGFISKARASAQPSKQYARLAPDLAVEVVSPNDKASEIHTKINQYLQFGTKMIWVAYPATRTVVVHTSAGAQTLTENDALDGGDVLPGFTLAIREIFS